jgi:2-polyprenyl-3-methyl-5-hydroxy-6-metoxy-1,4-benzoquinol methylase
LRSAAAGYLEGEVPRFPNSRAFSSGKLRTLLRVDGEDGGEAERGPARSAQTLTEGLHAARRTSQKRAKRISALKSEVSELEDARAKDKRLLHYLLSDAFDRRGPWVTGVRVDGKIYGRATRHSSPRLREFFEAFPEASRGRILEPGSLEGAMTLELARRAREVVGLEGRPQNVERAEFLKGLFGADNVAFYVTNLEKGGLSSYGKFDAVFCCGLLYHLAHPRAFVERAAAVAPNLTSTLSTPGPTGNSPSETACGAGSAQKTRKIPKVVSPAPPSGPPWTNFAGSSRRAATGP